jgi:hypothetical protein
MIDIILECIKNNNEIKEYLLNASVLAIKYEDGKIYDIMIFLEDDIFTNQFSPIYGSNFVIDKHTNHYDIFIRIKNYSWIKKDFSRRLPIALWILKNSIILQEKEKKITSIINLYQNKFESMVVDMACQKYLELRSERHNLRFSLKRNDHVASTIIKATIVKLSLELCFLSERKPYPFKILLPQTATEQSEYGEEMLNICRSFLNSTIAEESIFLSDKLIQKLIDMLDKKLHLQNDFLEKWWLHLT